MIGFWNDPEKVTREPKRISNKVAFTISAITPKKIQRSTTYTPIIHFLIPP
jgi:hypothetical protein